MKARTVMLVEKDNSSRQDLKQYLHHAGFHVAEAKSLKHVLKSNRKTSPDIMLIRHRDINGQHVESFQAVKSRYPNLYTIAITEPDELAELGSLMQKEIDGFVVSSFIAETLEPTLLQAISFLRQLEENEQLHKGTAEQERYFNTLLDSVGEGVVVVGQDMTICYANRSFQNMLNLPTKSLKDVDLQKHLDEGFKVLHNLFQQLASGNRPQGYRVTLKPRQASPVDVTLNAEFLSSASGYVRGMILIFEDKTLHDDAFIELMRSEKLKIIRFLANRLAHELFNPLNIISGRIELLQKDITNDELRGSFDTINKQAQRIRTMVGRLQRFNHSKEDNIPELFPLIDWLEKFLDTQSDDRVRFRLNFDDRARDILVQANHVQIEDAFNYLLHTLREIKPQPADIEIDCFFRAARASQTALELQIDVSDTDLPKDAYDPYRTIEPVGNSSILDIALTYTILNNYGAKIYVEREDESKRIKLEFSAAGIRRPEQETEKPQRAKFKSVKNIGN